MPNKKLLLKLLTKNFFHLFVLILQGHLCLFCLSKETVKTSEGLSHFLTDVISLFRGILQVGLLLGFLHLIQVVKSFVD